MHIQCACSVHDTQWACSAHAACLRLLASRVLFLLDRRQLRLPRRLLLLPTHRPGCTVPRTSCARLGLGLVPPTGREATCNCCLHLTRHCRLRLRRLQRLHKPFDSRRHRPLPQRVLRRAVQSLATLAPRR